MSNSRVLGLALTAVLCLASTARSQNYTVSHLAGNPGGGGAADGIGAIARFASPAGVAVDADGTIYVADLINHTIRVVTAEGVVTTLAGSPGQPGYADGQGASARFFQPWGIAVDASRNVYVADMMNRAIRKVTPAGVVTTVAGSPSAPAEAVDGTGSAAHFASVMGIAASPDGTFLVTDPDANVVRRMTAGGTVTTIAGAIGQFGSSDGVGSQARFAVPYGITVAPDGVAYVVDANAGVVQRITTDNTVTTIAGSPGHRDVVDGAGSGARFSNPLGITYGPGGVLFVTDANTVRSVTPGGSVTTVAGAAFVPGAVDGLGTAARFSFPVGIAADGAGNLFVAEGNNHTLRKIGPGFSVSTLAGAAPRPSGYRDGPLAEALFDQFSALAVSPRGDLFTAGFGYGAIRKITPGGLVSTFAGNRLDPRSVDGPLDQARFTQVIALAFGPDATLYLYEPSRLRAIAPDGTVRTVAGDAEPGAVDGHGSAARLSASGGNAIAVGPDGTVYLADNLNNVIRKISPAGDVTTWLGQAGAAGHVDATGTAARFAAPGGIAVSRAGLVYVCDQHNRVIRVVTHDGVVSTLAGAPGEAASVDGLGAAARFVAPAAITIDNDGNLFVEDGSRLRRVTPSGMVTTIAGGPLAGSDDGLGRAARFNGVVALATLTDGTVVAAEAGGRAIRYAVPTRFLAEGASSAMFNTRVAMFNPGPVDAYAVLTFQRAGESPVTQVEAVPAGHRVTLDAATIPELSSAEFSTTVDASQPLVVDRTLSWSGGIPYGAHAETAVRAPSLTWYLAEGATHSGMQLFYLLQNPNAASAQVRVRFLRPVGAPLEKTYTLAPESRTNIWVNVEEFPVVGAALSGTDVSAVLEVQNGQPIIVERALYLDVPGQFFAAGHESMGVTAPAREWFLAEGATGTFFDLFVLIANPRDAEAQVEATFLLPNGETVIKPYTIAANSRFNIWVDQADARLADTAVSTTIRSLNDVPIIVERALWWPEGGWYEAHNTPGATTTGIAWAVAEGELDVTRGLETYLLVANTSSTAATVKVTLHFEDGTTATQTFTGIAPRSRFNVSVAAQFAQAAGKRFGAVVESLGETPAQIVVERAMYWDAAGQVWAAGTNALATRLR